MNDRHVQLVLATGSNAGAVAPIRPGYYMIGRLRDCQIRPKSRSVSRRHCLVWLADDGLRVMDLGSSSGTKVDGIRLAPRQWTPLNHESQLRCGKVAFSVALDDVAASAAAESTAAESTSAPDRAAQCRDTRSAEPAKNEPRRNSDRIANELPVATGRGSDQAADDAGTGSPPDRPLASQSETPPAVRPEPALLVTGKPWQAADVASFLSSEDDVDRERRYDRIRSEGNRPDAEADFGLADARGQFDSDEGVTQSDVTGAAGTAPAVRSPASGKTPPKRLPRAKRRRLKTLAISADTDRLKIVAAGVLAALLVSYVGIRSYGFVSGPEVVVIEGLE